MTTASKATCVHHYRETERTAELAHFRCVNCSGTKTLPVDPPLRQGAPGYRQGATLLGAIYYHVADAATGDDALDLAKGSVRRPRIAR